MSYLRNKLSHNQNNILNVYNLATPDIKVQGALWYPTAQDFAVKLSEKYYIDFIKVVGVISALSPQNPWEWNMRDAERVIASFSYMGEDIDPRGFGDTFASGRAVMKAVAILSSKNLTEIPNYFSKVHKTRNFFHNILDPNDERYLTIDSHASNIWNGSKLSSSQLAQVFKNSGHRYERIVDDYREVAKYLNIMPMVLQATTWITWKEIILSN